MSNTMKLSSETLEILGNFAGIQPNILIQPGNTLNTLADARNIMGTVDLPQSFPEKMAIYDLPEFLGVLSLLEDPQLSFTPNAVEIQNGSGTSKAKYHYSSEDVLTFPSKQISPPPADVTFDVSQAVMEKLKKAASVFGHDMIVFKNGSLTVCSEKQIKSANSNSDNYYTTSVPTNVIAEDLGEFSGVIAIENFKFVPDDYTVDVTRAKLATFTGKNKGVKYFVSMHNESKFGE